MDVPILPKVSALITQRHQLMVFRKPFHPGTGTQVPAGSIEPGETPENAVVREAEEETGLTGFTLQSLLGHHLIDMRPYGRHECHDRWFFHLTAPPGSPQTWRHGESDPSDGPKRFIPFDFFWVDLDDATRLLRTENQSALSALRQRL